MPDWLLSFLTHPVTILFLGGGAGTNARYWFGRFVAELQTARFPELEFPWGTLAINVSGSIILGAVAAWFYGFPTPTGPPGPISRNWYLLLATGFCGGFTTFSTFSLETVQLLHDGKVESALGYVLASVVAGVVGLWLAVRVVAAAQ
jgi:CrcB protein